jgi:putative hydrolase of the HAD superfamily
MASHHVGINKPDPAIFHKFCEMYSVEPTDVVFFDDGLVNVESALTVGFSAYQIDPNRSTAEQIRTALAKEGIL